MIERSLLPFIRFSRPHTIIGTTLSVTTLFLIAWFLGQSAGLLPPTAGFEVLLLWGKTLVACLGANIFIVGLNQITDIEIDKINKPELPLASGDFTLQTAYRIIAISVILSLWLAYSAGPYLLLTVILSLLLGTGYSLPPFRWKRFYFWAAFCIIAVRGFIVNILIYLHFQYQLTEMQGLPGPILLLTSAMLVYSLIIAWFKDIPDMEGDAKFQIRTMSIRLGAAKVFRFGNIMLGSTLFALSLVCYIYPLALNAQIMGLTHLGLLMTLYSVSKQMNLNNHSAIRRYYLFIWVLFFAEYLIFAVAAGVGT